MLLLLSPSKKLDFQKKIEKIKASQPVFKKEIKELIYILKNKKKGEIKNLMSLSDNLAQLNYDRYQNFEDTFNHKNSKQAIFAFKGDVYDGLDIESLNELQINDSNKKIAIISGLYGLLKPFDLIQPYRLEMGTSLKTNLGENLYDFWEEKITNKINDLEGSLIINLASQEYFKSIKKNKLIGKLINIDFKEAKNEKISTIGIYAKKARGMMARYVLQHNITKIEDLKKFNVEGYRFAKELSNENKLTFIRKHD